MLHVHRSLMIYSRFDLAQIALRNSLKCVLQFLLVKSLFILCSLPIAVGCYQVTYHLYVSQYSHSVIIYKVKARVYINNGGGIQVPMIR